MSLMNEYITKKYSTVDMIKELRKLIKLYNDKQGTYLLVYAGAISKPIPDISLNMDDYYILFDLLRNVGSKSLIYILRLRGVVVRQRKKSLSLLEKILMMIQN